MKVMVLGSGGREHALAWKLRRDGHDVWCAPGNAGIARIAELVDLKPTDICAVADYVQQSRFDLTVVGPEDPLVAGIADEFRGRGLPIFGPGRDGAQLEGSKAFAKALMQECGIPTARFETFTDVRRAQGYLDSCRFPLVIKASGLALGKGAVIVRSREEATLLLEQMLVCKAFGPAGETVVIEEFLVGEEASIIGITDGSRVACLAPSQDHKASRDGDQGPNTGGMGAYAPAPLVTPELQAAVEERVFAPLLAGLRRRGIDYRGVIYAGIMVTADGPQVLEFNCRFGDPETQVILPLYDGDLAELLLAAANGRLPAVIPRVPARCALCVVAASEGYPGTYPKGRIIRGDLEGSADTLVFHAGTKEQDGQVVTSGGRVLGVTGLAATLTAAKARAYAGLERIRFDGMQFRSDIGDKGLRRLAAQRTVLLICTGNTCRSAMADALLEARVKGRPIDVISAGTNTIDGLPASAGAAAAMAELGLDLDRFRSHALTRELVRRADLVLVMEPRHERRVRELEPDAAARTYLLTEYGGGPGGPVEDPVGSELDVYREVAKIIAQCLDRVLVGIAE